MLTQCLYYLRIKSNQVATNVTAVAETRRKMDKRNKTDFVRNSGDSGLHDGGRLVEEMDGHHDGPCLSFSQWTKTKYLVDSAKFE